MNDFDNLGSERSVSTRLVELVLKMASGDQKALLKRLEERIYKGQRAHVRKPFFMVVDFNKKIGDYNDFINNISAGGLFIETPEGFSIGEEIHVNFPLPRYRRIINVTGEVVRTTPEGIGLKFKTLNQKQELMIKSLLEVM